VKTSEANPGAGRLPGATTKFGDCNGCAGITRAAIHWDNWQPGIGLAYMVNNRTVVRGGFYMTFLDGGVYEYGTAQSASFMSSLLAGSFLRGSTGSSISDYGSWDASPLPLPQSTPFSPTIGNGGGVFNFPSKNRQNAPLLPNGPSVGIASYDSAWNISLERQLPWNMLMTVSYVGNRAIHLPATLELSN
jgi:hypothetical protein